MVIEPGNNITRSNGSRDMQAYFANRSISLIEAQ